MYEEFKEFVLQYITYNFAEWQMLKSRLSTKKFDTNATILRQGEVCKELYFLNSGLARGYMIDEEGRDSTWNIFFNDGNATMKNLFVVEYDSFLHQKASTIFIEALEPCEVVVMQYDDVQFLYDKLKRGERFGRLMAEEAYSYLHNKYLGQKLKSAKERFGEFMSETPHLMGKVPQYHIASYLGITPQHLCRLKKKASRFGN